MQLETHLALKPDDRDMVLMLHEMEYSIGLQRRKRRSWLKVEGTNHQQTAMAKTVGLPLGIAANLLLIDQLPQRGVHIPVLPEIYEPVLRELSKVGIQFEESEHILSNA